MLFSFKAFVWKPVLIYSNSESIHSDKTYSWRIGIIDVSTDGLSDLLKQLVIHRVPNYSSCDLKQLRQ